MKAYSVEWSPKMLRQRFGSERFTYSRWSATFAASVILHYRLVWEHTAAEK